MTAERRYPLDPLREIADLSRRQLRTELGISNTQLQRFEVGGLTDEQADRYAVRLGLFPWQVWPTYDLDGTGWDLDHPSVRCRTQGVPPDLSSSEQP